MNSYASRSRTVGMLPNALFKKRSESDTVFQATDHYSPPLSHRTPQTLVQTHLQTKPTAQLHADNGYRSASQHTPQNNANPTGLPDTLKSGLERLSGYSMQDVKVHYNSSKPAQLQAHAYAQGSHIHLASGQEKHLPHEAWHVVQQKQGRVRATTQLKGQMNVNDDSRLEREADVMGERAAHYRGAQAMAHSSSQFNVGHDRSNNGEAAVQLKVKKYAAGRWYSTFDPYKEHSTKAKATAYDKLLRTAGRSELSARVPTLYTYTHTKPHCKISSIPQGPHTVAHRVTLSTLTSITTMAEVQAIFDEQVVNADEVNDFLNHDELPPSGAFNVQIQKRLDRFLDDYETIHDNLMLELSKAPGDLVLAKHLLNQLLNMDPYAVYAWKTTAAASKASLKAKSEAVADPVFADMYDTPPASSFRSQTNLDDFVDHREELFDTYMG